MSARPGFLVVEDDAAVGRALARRLAHYGDTRVVRSCGDALRALEARRYAALVVDVGLPDGSGLDVIAEARALDRGIHALVVSGSVDATRLAEAHSLGVHVLLKPVESEQLEVFAARVCGQVTSQVETMLDHWRARYELTDAETDILRRAVRGTQRSDLAAERAVAPSTVKKQIQLMLDKMGDATLESAVNRLLRTALART